MQEFVPMDATDIEILAALKADGRMTNRDLGQLVNLSEAACSRRVSDLVRGKWQKFSLDMQVTLATRAGRKVAVAVA